MTRGGKTQTRYEAIILKVNDGKRTWERSDKTLDSGEEYASYTVDDSSNDRHSIEWLEKDASLKLVGEDAIEGAACWKLEAHPNKEMLGPRKPGEVVTTIWFRKDCGLPVQMITTDLGKEVGSLRMEDLKLGVKVDATRFRYQPPDGVEVRDRSRKRTYVVGSKDDPAKSGTAESKP